MESAPASLLYTILYISLITVGCSVTKSALMHFSFERFSHPTLRNRDCDYISISHKTENWLRKGGQDRVRKTLKKAAQLWNYPLGGKKEEEERGLNMGYSKLSVFSSELLFSLKPHKESSHFKNVLGKTSQSGMGWKRCTAVRLSPSLQKKRK